MVAIHPSHREATCCLRAHRGFTLIELLIVIAIIAILLGMLIPAVQMVRMASDNSKCLNNLRQIGIASHNYEGVFNCFPSLGTYDPAGGTTWSVHSRLLPFIEEENINKLIDFNASYDAQPQVTSQRISTFMCPSEVNDKGYQETATRLMYPSSYGFCYGTWFIYDPELEQGGDGAIMLNGSLRMQQVTDGLSNTMYAADVKAWTPYYRDAAGPDELSTPPPSSVEELIGYCKGGKLVNNPALGHTEWVDGRSLHTGFTTVFTPNTPVMLNGLDIDFVSYREGRSPTRRTFAAITARSYHVGHVNVLFMDGSARSISDGIDLQTWRALGTRAGGDMAVIIE